MWCSRSTWIAGPVFVTLLATMPASAAVWFRTTELPWAVLGAGYSARIQAEVDGRCPQGDLVISIVDGSLPRGLIMQGVSLAGVPRELGAFHFRVRATNICESTETDMQLLVTGKPILRVMPEQLTFEYRPGEPAPKPQRVLVSGTWPDFAYSVMAREPWLRAGPAEGMTPSSDSAFSADAVTVQVLPKDLAPGWYETTLAVSAHQIASAPEIPVKLHVLPAAAPR